MRVFCREFLAALLLSLAAAGLVSCRRTPEQSYATLLESGGKYLGNKDYGRAILQYKTAIQKSPRKAEAYYQLGLTYLASGSIREAVVTLVKAAEVDPKHAGVQIKLAELLANSQDRALFEDGRKRMQDILSASPNQGDALTALALTESRLGDLQNAEQHLRQALRGSPASLKASALLARVLLARRDPAGAEEVLKSVVDQEPQSADARLALAEFYMSLNRLPDADKALRAALEIDGKNAQAMLGLAAIQMVSGKQEEAGSIYRQVSGLGDNRFRHLYGAYLFTLGKREAAIQEFEKLAQRSPADRDARSRLVAAYIAVQRTADAERLLDSALKRNPKDVDALQLKSELLLRAGKLGDAQKNLAEVLRFKPESAEAHLALAKVYGARGNVFLQRKELTEAIGLAPELLEARIELARNLLDSNSANMALDLLDKAPASQKRTLTFMVLRNHTLLATGDEAEFAKGVSEGLKAARIPDLLVQEAQLKLLKKDFAGTRAALAEALKLNPEHLGALDVTLQMYTTQKNPSAGLEALRQHAARYAGSSRIQRYFGERMLAAGRLGPARAAYTAAKAADRTSIEPDIALAQIDLLEGNLDAARRPLAAIASSAADRPVVHLLLASVETRAGNYTAAMEHYRKVLEADPASILALNNLAYLLAEYAKRPDEALKYAQKAKELQPDNVDIGGTIGRLYYNKGIYATALQYLRDAVTRDAAASGANPILRKYYLGMTYLKLGQRQEGLRVLEQAFKLGPELPEAQLARAVMREATQPPRQ